MKVRKGSGKLFNHCSFVSSIPFKFTTPPSTKKALLKSAFFVDVAIGRIWALEKRVRLPAKAIRKYRGQPIADERQCNSSGSTEQFSIIAHRI